MYRLVSSSPMRRRCSREKTTWVPDDPMSMPTLCRVTLSCCQIGLSSRGRSSPSWSWSCSGLNGACTTCGSVCSRPYIGSWSWLCVTRSSSETTTCGPPRQGGPHVGCAGSGGGLGREVLQLLLVRLVHLRLQAVLGQGLREGLAHVRRLVGVVDLVAADALADPGLRHALRVADRHDLVLEGEVAGRLGPGVEVLVVPHVRRDDQRAGTPLVAGRLLALGPHEAVALAGQDDHVRARAVAVALLVRGRRELRDVAVHRALGHVEADVPAP